MPQKSVFNKKQINLLTGAYEWSPALKEIEKLKRFITIHVVWGIVLALITALIVGFNAYQNYQIKKLQQSITAKKNYLAANKEKLGLYVNTYVREVYLQKLAQEKYDPQKLVNFIDSVIEPTGKIHGYQIDSAGNIQLRISAPSLDDAAKLWFYLASNKETIESLNLKSFSISDESSVSFTLQGNLNVKKVYELYGFR